MIRLTAKQQQTLGELFGPGSPDATVAQMNNGTLVVSWEDDPVPILVGANGAVKGGAAATVEESE